jgi:hypothetical protein
MHPERALPPCLCKNCSPRGASPQSMLLVGLVMVVARNGLGNEDARHKEPLATPRITNVVMARINSLSGTCRRAHYFGHQSGGACSAKAASLGMVIAEPSSGAPDLRHRAIERPVLNSHWAPIQPPRTNTDRLPELAPSAPESRRAPSSLRRGTASEDRYR